MEITSGVGARIAYDPIAGPMLATMMSMIAKNGIVVAYGMLSSQPTILPLFERFLKYVTIKIYDIDEVYDDDSLLSATPKYVFSRNGNRDFRPLISTGFSIAEIAGFHINIESSDHICKIIVAP